MAEGQAVDIMNRLNCLIKNLVWREYYGKTVNYGS